MSKPFEKKTYYALSLDPIHVGMGGYRLGRVDMSIIREPGTNLPKLPGTSLSGVARAYTALATGKYRWPENAPAAQQLSCAGKGGEGGEKHCGKNNCPVCIPYGFSKGKSSFQGLAQFFDARILFFPVRSRKGPVWVTCPSVLKEHGVDDASVSNEANLRLLKFKTKKDGKDSVEGLELNATWLNLGWLMLGVEEELAIDLNTKWKDFPMELSEIRKSAVMVSDSLFPRIVNDNLEVRTSVAIDPATGAAEGGALYSYEALPRATVLWFEVVFNKPQHFRLKVLENDKPVEKQIETGSGYEGDNQWKWVRDSVKSGLELMQYLGIGGMGTRGMGRLKVLNLKDEAEDQKQPAEKSASGGGK